MPRQTETSKEIDALIESLPVAEPKTPFVTTPAHSSPSQFADPAHARIAETALDKIINATPVPFMYSADDKLDDVLRVARRSPPLFRPVLDVLSHLAERLVGVDTRGFGDLTMAAKLSFARKIGAHAREIARQFPGEEPERLPTLANARPADVLTRAQAETDRMPLPRIAAMRDNAAQAMLDISTEAYDPRYGTMGVEIGWVAEAVKVSTEDGTPRREGLAILATQAKMMLSGRFARKEALFSFVDQVPLTGPESDRDLSAFCRKIIDDEDARLGRYNSLMRRLVKPTLGERVGDVFFGILGVKTGQSVAVDGLNRLDPEIYPEVEGKTFFRASRLPAAKP